MQNRINLENNAVKNFNKEGDVNMNNSCDAKDSVFFTEDYFDQNKSSSKFNEKGEMIDMENIKDNEKITSFDKKRGDKSKPQRVTMVWICKKDGLYLVGVGDAIFTPKGKKIIGKKTFKWVILDDNPISAYKYAYTVLGEKLSKAANHKHKLNYILVVNSQIAIKYFMALTAAEKGGMQEAIKIMATVSKEFQEELVESATFLLKAITNFKEASGKSVFLEDYVGYFCDPLNVTEEAEKQLYDGMTLYFEKSNCVNVQGVSFMKKWRTQNSSYKLKIHYKYEHDDNGNKIKTPLKYTALLPCDANGVPESERGAFMKMLHDILEELLPKIALLSEKEQEEIFDEYFN